MRTLVIGDIHGCMRAFDGILGAVQPQPGDRIITLGDYVDRGPDSRGVIDRVIDLSRRFELIPLIGNHEEMMLDARNDAQAYRYWRLVGGDKTVASYSESAVRGDLSSVPHEHWDFLMHGCRDFYETDTHIFVHGWVDEDVEMPAQEVSTLRWRKFREVRPHCSGKTIICGHTAQGDGKPVNLGFGICIDTCVYGGGWLSCLELETGRLWQANQQGHLQALRIEEFRQP